MLQPPLIEEQGKFAILPSFLTFALLAILVCAAYTAAASWLLWAFLAAQPGLESGAFLWKLAVKGFVSALAVLIVLPLLWRTSRQIGSHKSAPYHAGAYRIRWLAPPLLIAAALVVPHLNDYPRTAPDELHHMIVARNLSEHALYASGHPDKGFRIFDPFDSVGAPVILPVAGMIRILGTEIWPARLVIAMYFLALCACAWAFVSPIFGPVAATGAAMFLPLAFSSIYLGRSVYGEAPGLFFVLLGLLFWRRALHRQGIAAGIAAGAAFGLAVLCKTILVLGLLAVAVTALLDRLTERRIRLFHLLAPATGALAVLGAWFVVQWAVGRPPSENAGGTLGLYRQYLLAGWGAAVRNFPLLLARPWAHLVILCCVPAVAVRIVHRRYDPPFLVLVLTAVLLGYWWVFFTPGQHPRYLWYTYAISGMCTGIVAATMLAAAFQASVARTVRVLLVLLSILAVAPWANWLISQTREVYTNREMAADRALAAYVATLPKDCRIGSDHYPVRGMLGFLTGRWIEIDADAARLAPSCDVVIRFEDGAAARRIDAERGRFGPYLVTRTTRDATGR